MVVSDIEAGETSPSLEALIAMMKRWEESGFEHIVDESQRRQIEILDDTLQSGFPKPANEASIRSFPHSAASLQKTLRDVVPTLEKFRKQLLTDIEIATERTRRLTLMCGVAALSDDLLAKIFDIAALDSGNGKPKTAVNVSRVSKRFRSVALSSHALWNFIFWSTDSPPDSFHQVTLCLQRSSQNPIEVMFEDASTYDRKISGSVVFARFFNAVLPHVARWKSFTFQFQGKTDITTDICNVIANLDSLPEAPLFQKLSLKSWFHSQILLSGESGFPIPFSKWSIPSLREIVLRNFEVDLKAFPTLENITQCVQVSNFNFNAFYVDLMAFRSLKFLGLGILTGIETEQLPEGIPRLDLPTLSELILSLRVTYNKPFDALITSINCPNITELTVHFLYSIDDEDLWGYGTKMKVTQHYIRLLFCLPNRFRRVESLTLSMKQADCVDADEGDVGHMLYAVPFEHLPSLRKLYLIGSLKSLRPYKKSYAQRYEIEENKVFPAIEMISVRSLRPERLYDWIGKVMKKLEKQGDWERCFDYLVLGGKHTTFKGLKVSEIEYIPRDRIPEWIAFCTKSLVKG
ncbi:hypothetical protein SCHPADRAFT_120016 [Schizopora paradoxa]|uniref:F-box domain-containing protein n=1 Tax=Schizopora paradoxa TaxID=27342 RepID=A0A0H2S2F9_9AGAM|nr:hypothetical protein SCHPADRAFT_120016 [Schizopora paradoxa]